MDAQGIVTSRSTAEYQRIIDSAGLARRLGDGDGVPQSYIRDIRDSHFQLVPEADVEYYLRKIDDEGNRVYARVEPGFPNAVSPPETMTPPRTRKRRRRRR